MSTIESANGLRGLELRHLLAFDAVARHRSFTAAADELGYSQSAVSQQIGTAADWLLVLGRLEFGTAWDQLAGMHIALTDVSV